MKYIIAIVQPTRVEAVKQALSEIEIFRLTISDVKGAGRQKGHTEIFRGHEYSVNLINKAKFEIAVSDDLVETIIDAISNAARTGDEGEIGDGKIFVLPMEEVVRIRTKERGEDAI